MAFNESATPSRLPSRCLVCVFVLICVAGSSGCAASKQLVGEGSSADKKPPVLQVIWTITTSYYTERCLFLRVFQDGNVEYHDNLNVDLTQPIPVVAKKLTKEDIEELLTVLRLPSVQRLSGTFEREDLGVVSETLDIEIHRDIDVQKVSLLNFHSGRNVPGRPPYPEAAVRLACVVDRLGHKARSSDWQSKECKDLPKAN